jgi:DNA-binding NtrC family response regulator
MWLNLAKNTMSAPKKVMIVDDERDIVAIMELALRSNGYGAAGFSSPGKALEEIRNNGEYALVISDIRMPSMNGFELARKNQGGKAGHPARAHDGV